MKSVKVLGSGCTKCMKVYDLVKKVIDAENITADLTKVEDVKAIMGYGVMRTPAVVVDEKVVHSGGIPKEKDIVEWLK